MARPAGTWPRGQPHPRHGLLRQAWHFGTEAQLFPSGGQGLPFKARVWIKYSSACQRLVTAATGEPLTSARNGKLAKCLGRFTSAEAYNFPGR